MSEELIASLQARIQRLEDLEAIRRLKARYAALCDLKYRPTTLSGQAHLDDVATRIANLFTEDAIWDGGAGFGVTEGREAIRERFRKQTFRFAIHYFILPDITIEGDRATGLWYLLQPATTPADQAIWLAGAERDDYRRVGDDWLISRMTLDLSFIAPHAEGWAGRTGDGPR